LFIIQNVFVRKFILNIYALLKGFAEAWNQNMEFDWKPVLEYINTILKTGDFISNVDGGFDYPDWVIAQIAELIEIGTQKDDHAFEVALLPQAVKILLSINELVKNQEVDHHDAITGTINTTKGKILSALLNLSLRIARTSKDEPRWNPEIKTIFDKELSEKQSIELNTTVAMYLPNFIYLDKDWVLTNLKYIFPQKNECIWNAAMQGFLFNTKVINYKELFLAMKEAGNYEKGLSSHFNNQNTTNSIISHICIAYMRKWERIEEEFDLIYSLMYNHREYMPEVISIIRIQKIYSEEHVLLIKKLWQILFENNQDNPEILSDVLIWLKLFKTIDNDIFKWSLKGAKYLKYQNSFLILEALSNLSEDNPEKVGKIFLEILENTDTLPEYIQKDILHIVESLYSNNQKEIADKICNIYGSANILFLRDIYSINQ